VDNRSSVWTPLLHAVWKPDPAGRDQVRMSLTRSYRSPNLQSLIARRSLSIGSNSFDNPDRLGNPELRPELATGIDVAFERYLKGGGVLSANLFARRIQDLIRTVREEVPQGDGSTRWQSQPRNIGDADTRGLELEAKGRLSEWITDAPATDVRASLSVYRSSVDGIQGPDNRLDSQPDYTANLGADHRFRGTPFTVGGSLTWTPAYATQVSGIQRTLTGKRLGADAFVQWSVKPGMVLRVSATNLAALDDVRENGVTLTDAGVASNTRTVATTYTQWQVRLEAKL
jgi:iron complex outermembrane receptor protein